MYHGDMNEPELKDQIAALQKRTEEIYTSVERTRKYILIMVVISVAAVVLPLIGLIFAIPAFLSSYEELPQSGLLEGL